MNRININKNKQKGTVLVFSLVILSVLTLIAVTSLKTSIMDEKMTGNFRDGEIALQAAEAGMRDAFVAIDTLDIVDLNGADGLLNFADAEPDYLNQNTWADGQANYTESVIFDDPNQFARPPRRVIKFIDLIPICGESFDPDDPITSSPACNPRGFRVTVFGTGRSPNTTKVIQAYYRSPTP